MISVLDFPATGQQLWSLYDKGGPRPEYLLPVFFSESGFDPSIVNSIGCVGIAQVCPFAWPLPAGFEQYSASQQLAAVVVPMTLANAKKFGGLNSGTRAYQANFLPGTLPIARSLSSVLAVKGSPKDVCPGCGLSQAAVYAANPGLDYGRTGAIRVSDLAHFIGKAVSHPAVQSAIAATYALRPGQSPRDPVYGTDFSWWSRISSGERWLVGGTVAAGLAAAGVVAWDRKLLRP